MEAGPVGFAAKTKTRGKSDGMTWGSSRYSFSNGKWLRGGFELVLTDSRNLSRDFWIWKPLLIESELRFPHRPPAFWSFADKVMTCILFQAGRPEGHAIRPNSLKAATISNLTTEFIKGKANFSQLAIQGNYRAVTAHDMAKVYSRS